MHPFVGLALALRERGHRPLIATHGPFEGAVGRAGLDFAELGSREEHDALMAEPNLTRIDVAVRTVARRGVLEHLPRLYSLLENLKRQGPVVAIAPPLAFGARVAQEALGVPLVTVHTYPFTLRSCEDPNLLPVRAPRPIRRAIHRGIDWGVDAVFARGLNAFRRRHGLRPVHRISSDWWNSPEFVIALFPAWFAEPRADWPAGVTQSDFPVYDERASLEIPAEAEAFLAAGEPPVVVSTASWYREARGFFETALTACRSLGRRALLIAPHPEQVPVALPKGAIRVASAPYAWLLPKAAAFIHHAGIGSTAAALAAGVPQLVVPRIFDQPHNAAILENLGVARRLSARHADVETISRALEDIARSEDVAVRCRDVQDLHARGPGLDAACAAVERAIAGA